MRLLLVLLATAAVAQSLQFQKSHTAENLRGVSAVSRQIAWASGTHGTYLRTTDGGYTWIPAPVSDAATLDFRAVIAFSAEEAFLMSAGPGDQSRIYHTADAGQHWKLQFTNTNPKGFFDSMAFWDRSHGVVLGDPIPDASGKLKFELLLTEDGGETWHPVLTAQLPEALPAEGAFAASNSCIAILPSKKSAFTSTSGPWKSGGAMRPEEPWKSGASAPRQPRKDNEALAPEDLDPKSSGAMPPEEPWKSGALAPRQPRKDNGALAPEDLDPNIWFATGGAAARVFHSPDRGQTWEVYDTPILHGPESAGIFSIAFRNHLDGVIAGGDYKRPNFDGPNLAFTHDGGKTWEIANVHPQAYFSAVTYDAKVEEQARLKRHEQVKDELKRQTSSAKRDLPQRIFIVSPAFVYDLRPPKAPRRLQALRGKDFAFNAIAPFPEGGALLVGAKGAIAVIP